MTTGESCTFIHHPKNFSGVSDSNSHPLPPKSPSCTSGSWNVTQRISFFAAAMRKFTKRCPNYSNMKLFVIQTN